MTLIPRSPIYPVENYGSAYTLDAPDKSSLRLWVVSPWTPGSRSPRIYFTQYPLGTKPTQLTKKNALRAAYISRSTKGFLGCYDSVGGQVLDWERDAAMAWYFGYVRSLGLNGSKAEPCVTPGMDRSIPSRGSGSSSVSTVRATPGSSRPCPPRPSNGGSSRS
jgi:hypothetical protein